MTVEEIDILVQANIEGVVKEFQKLLPEIKKQIKQIKQQFDKTKIKDITAKVNMSQVSKEAKKVGKQIKEAFNPNDLSGLIINGKNGYQRFNEIAEEIEKEAQNVNKSIDKINEKKIEIIKPTQIKEVDEYTRKLNELYEQWGQGKISLADIQKFKTEYQPEPKIKITGFTEKADALEPSNQSLSLWDTLRTKIQQIKPSIQQFKQSLKSVNSSKELELVKYQISEIEEKLEKVKNGEIHLNTKEIIQAEAQFERLNKKKEKIEQSKKGNTFSGMLSSIKDIMPRLNGISGITIKIKNQIKQWSTGFKRGLSHILKYTRSIAVIKRYIFNFK